MTFCSSCGKPIQESALYCRHCGAPQSDAAPQPQAPVVISAPAQPQAPAAGPTPATSAQSRPRGVTALAILFLLFGVGAFFSISITSYMVLRYGMNPMLIFNLLLLLFYAPADFLIAIGLLKGRLWGWKLAVASTTALVFFLAIAAFVSIARGTSFSRMFPLLLQMVIAAFVNTRLTKPNIRSYFGAEQVWTWLKGLGKTPGAG